MWYDVNVVGDEMGVGFNLMWYVKNLEKGIWGLYVVVYKFDLIIILLIGIYVCNYDSVVVVFWLWNVEKKVFLLIEDKQLIDVKVDYVIDKEIGGIMFWELVGDYSCYNFDVNGKCILVDFFE